VIVFGFIPTESVRAKGVGAMTAYVAFLLIGTVIFVGMPIFLYHKSEKQQTLKRKRLQKN